MTVVMFFLVSFVKSREHILIANVLTIKVGKT